MKSPMKVVAVCVLICGLWGAALAIDKIAHVIEYPANTYFAEALRAADISERVSVGGHVYDIAGGEVISQNGDTLSPEIALRALKTGYALALARRDPLLGIAGTNPEKLRVATDELRNVQDSLQAVQQSPRDAALVGSLYPTHFLDALASLEEARKTFLASGAERDGANYELEVRLAADAGRRDARLFEGSLLALLSKDAGDIRYVGFGGTITTSTLRQSASAVRVRMNEVRQVAEKREQCFSGIIAACEPGDLSIGLPQKSVSEEKEHDELLPSIRSILKEANIFGSKSQSVEVILPSSSCAGALPGPYHFLVSPLDEPVGIYARFINDLFFVPSEHFNGPVLTYLRIQRGISLSLISPTTFYRCPEVGEDFGNLYSSLAIQSFARQYPSIVSNLQAEVSRTPLRAVVAASYLEELIRQLPKREVGNEVLELRLMYVEKSARLDIVVDEIARMMQNDLLQYGRGVPFDMSAHTLFVTHSAFPSLFLFQNPSAGVEPVIVQSTDEQDIQKLLEKTVRYSDIYRGTPREEVVENIRNFLMFEYEK